MKKFFRTVNVELKKDLSFILIMVVLILSLGNIIIHQICIERGLEMNRDIAKFIETEQKRLSEYENFFQLRRSGFPLITIPQPLFYLFFNSTPFKNIESLLDGIIRVNLTVQKKGANAFDQPLGKSNLDFSWFYLFFGSAAALLLGISKSRNKEYIKFLASLSSLGTVTASILVSTILIILGFLILTFVVIVIQLSVFKGLSLNANEIHNLLAFLFLPGFLTFFVFSILGFLFGMLKNIIKVVALSVSAWFLLIAFIPEIFNAALSRHTSTLFDSIYTHELKKLEIFSRAEKKILAEVSKYNTPEEIKNAYKLMIRQYLETDFKEIVGLEEKMLKDTQKAADIVHLWSIFTPTTFYKSVGNEISGCAYNGYIDFYKTNIKNYREFVTYCLENTTERIKPKDKPFIKNPADYVVHLKSSLPKYFAAGLLFNALIIVLLIVFSYSRFCRLINPEPLNKEAYSKLELNYESGNLNRVLYEEEDDFLEQTYNLFMGKGDMFPGKISLDGKNIVPGNKQDFFYLPAPDAIPGEYKIKHLVDIFTNFAGLSENEMTALKSELEKEFDRKLSGIKFGKLNRLEKISLLSKLVKYNKNRVIITNKLLNGVSILVGENLFKQVYDELKSRKDRLIIELDLVTSNLYSKNDSYSMVYIKKDYFKERKIR